MTTQTIRNGTSIEVVIPTGQTLKVVAVSGTYNASVVRGTGIGTTLSTLATGASYGPYAYDSVVRLVSSDASEIDFDVAVTPVVDSDTEPKFAFDSSGNVTGLVGPGGGVALRLSGVSDEPYKIAFWGDSRYNACAGVSAPDIIGTSIATATTRAPTWIIGFLGDAEYYQTYAVSGDAAVNWASASRTAGKTFSALNTSISDIVCIQYGINDIDSGGKNATQVTGYLQALVAEVFKSGKFVVFESILPINSPIASFASKQVTVDTVNANMQAWLANFPNCALYVDTATTYKAGGSYASYSYIDVTDGIHPTRLGAYTSGKLVAAAMRRVIPKRNTFYHGAKNPSPNLINLTSPTPITSQFNSNAVGTATVVQAQGQDSRGHYYEWQITTTALAGGYAKVECQMSANLQTASPPFVALAGNEVVQATASIVLDDGSGGAPNAYEANLRQRFYTGGVYHDWSGTNAAPAVTDSDFGEKLDISPMTGRMFVAAASVVANPSMGGGLIVSVFVSCQRLGYTRLRVYNPSMRRVGYSSIPVSSTVGASPATITNTTNSPQLYVISGGTVSSITIGGVTTGVTSGTFVLDPADSMVVTHTGAPTQVLKQLLTQQSLRNFT